MASKKFEKGSEEFLFFMEFWQMVQKYYIPEDSDEYWDDLLSQAAKLTKKYQGSFYSLLTMAFIDYVERISKDD